MRLGRAVPGRALPSRSSCRRRAVDAAFPRRLRGDRASAALAQGRAEPSTRSPGRFDPDEHARSRSAATSAVLSSRPSGTSAYQGPKQALAASSTSSRSGNRIERDCHRIALTRLVRRRSSGTTETSRARSLRARRLLRLGYYHGMLERALVGVKSSKRELGRRSRAWLCARRRRIGGVVPRLPVPSRPRSRVHDPDGLRPPTGSLSVCARLGTAGITTRARAASFMENLARASAFARPGSATTIPLYPCDASRARDRHSCYLRVTRGSCELNGDDFADGADAACSRSRRTCGAACFRGVRARRRRSDARDARRVRGVPARSRASGCAARATMLVRALRRTFATVSGTTPSARRPPALCARVAPRRLRARLLSAGSASSSAGSADGRARRAACATCSTLHHAAEPPASDAVRRGRSAARLSARWWLSTTSWPSSPR